MGPLLARFPKSSPRFHAILRLRNVRNQQAAYPPCQGQSLQRAGLAPVALSVSNVQSPCPAESPGRAGLLSKEFHIARAHCMLQVFPSTPQSQPHFRKLLGNGNPLLFPLPTCPEAREGASGSGSLERQEMAQVPSGCWVHYGAGAASKVLHGGKVGTPNPGPEHQKGVSRS